MKLAASRKVHYDSGPNLTPLVDVALVILIFMMLVGSFGAGEHYLQAKVPATSGGGGTTGALDEPVVVHLEPGVGGGMAAWFLDQRAESAEGLRDQMAALHRRLAAAASGAADKTLIVLIPDGRVPYKQTIAAYQAILRAGFTRVAFSSGG